MLYARNTEVKMNNLDTGEKVVRAIWSIRPNSEFHVLETYSSLAWISKDQDKPTEAEFNNAVTAWNREYDAQEYARDRAPAYPSVGDQLDMIYKDNKNSTTTHADAVETVKAQFPKP